MNNDNVTKHELLTSIITSYSPLYVNIHNLLTFHFFAFWIIGLYLLVVDLTIPSVLAASMFVLLIVIFYGFMLLSHILSHVTAFDKHLQKLKQSNEQDPNKV